MDSNITDITAGRNRHGLPMFGVWTFAAGDVQISYVPTPSGRSGGPPV